jgi:hypothetical protein
LHLDKLSTFGLLKRLTQPEVLLMIDALMALECLEQIEKEQFRPLIQITELGTEVMKGKAPLAGPLPLPEYLLRKVRGEKVTVATVVEAHHEPADRDTLEALKHWRAEMADKAGVPRYVIFGNEVLVELARCRPQSRDELLKIKGVGPVKAQRYGESLLKMLRAGDGLAKQPRVTGPPDSPAALVEGGDEAIPPPSSVARSAHYWTQRLSAAGFTIDECMAIRGLSRETVLEHTRQTDGSH